MKLVFHVNTGLGGRFTTVRPFQEVEKVRQGETIQMVTPGGELIGSALARDAWVGDLARIPAAILEMEQNALHRTYSGLIMGLRAVGTELLEPSSKVVALILDYIEVPEKEIIIP